MTDKLRALVPRGCQLTAQWERCEFDSACPYCGADVLIRVVRIVRRRDSAVMAECHYGAKCSAGCWIDEEYEEPDALLGLGGYTTDDD